MFAIIFIRAVELKVQRRHCSYPSKTGSAERFSSSKCNDTGSSSPTTVTQWPRSGMSTAATQKLTEKKCRFREVPDGPVYLRLWKDCGSAANRRCGPCVDGSGLARAFFCYRSQLQNSSILRIMSCDGRTWRLAVGMQAAACTLWFGIRQIFPMRHPWPRDGLTSLNLPAAGRA
jgi:hypothetical protein